MTSFPKAWLELFADVENCFGTSLRIGDKEFQIKYDRKASVAILMGRDIVTQCLEDAPLIINGHSVTFVGENGELKTNVDEKIGFGSKAGWVMSFVSGTEKTPMPEPDTGSSKPKAWADLFADGYTGTLLLIGDIYFPIKIDNKTTYLAILMGTDVVVQPLKVGTSHLIVNDHFVSTCVGAKKERCGADLDIFVDAKKLFGMYPTPPEEMTDRHEERKKSLTSYNIMLVYESPEYAKGSGEFSVENLKEGEDFHVDLFERTEVAYFPEIIAELFGTPTEKQRELITFLEDNKEKGTDVMVPFSANAFRYLVEALQGVERVIPAKYRERVHDLAVRYDVALLTVARDRAPEPASTAVAGADVCAGACASASASASA